MPVRRRSPAANVTVCVRLRRPAAPQTKRRLLDQLVSCTRINRERQQVVEPEVLQSPPVPCEFFPENKNPFRSDRPLLFGVCHARAGAGHSRVRLVMVPRVTVCENTVLHKFRRCWLCLPRTVCVSGEEEKINAAAEARVF